MLPQNSIFARLFLCFFRFVDKIIDKSSAFIWKCLGLKEDKEKFERTHSSDLLPCFDQVCQAIYREGEEREREGEEKERKKKTIFVTGHSLGGALATLFVAKSLSDNLFEEEEEQGKGKRETTTTTAKEEEKLGKFGGLYTFGAPKVGNCEFGEVFESVSHKIFRIVLRYDLIPHIPTTNMGQTAHQIAKWLQSSIDPSVLKEEEDQENQLREDKVGYVHPPGTFLFLSRGVLLSNPSFFSMAKAQVTGMLDWKLFEELQKESYLRRLFRVLFPFFVNDHLPGDYVNHLHAIFEKEKQKEKNY